LQAVRHNEARGLPVVFYVKAVEFFPGFVLEIAPASQIRSLHVYKSFSGFGRSGQRLRTCFFGIASKSGSCGIKAVSEDRQTKGDEAKNEREKSCGVVR